VKETARVKETAQLLLNSPNKTCELLQKILSALRTVPYIRADRHELTGNFCETSFSQGLKFTKGCRRLLKKFPVWRRKFRQAFNDSEERRKQLSVFS
jgi:hypothetical protein